MKIRAMTYNIHKGFCYYSRQYVLEKLRDSLHEVNADVVFLQEVMGVHPELEDQFEISSQFEFLADSVWPHFSYGKNAVYSSGNHGNAILSKFPVEDYSNLNISTNRFEKRGLLHTKLNIDQKVLHLFCLHFDLRETGRVQQLQTLMSELSLKVGENDPVIVAGDFNDWRQKLSEELILKMNFSEIGLATFGHHLKTFPAWWPFWSMDRMYARNLEINSAQVLKEKKWRQLSDHLPLLAEFTILA